MTISMHVAINLREHGKGDIIIIIIIIINVNNNDSVIVILSTKNRFHKVLVYCYHEIDYEHGSRHITLHFNRPLHWNWMELTWINNGFYFSPSIRHHICIMLLLLHWMNVYKRYEILEIITGGAYKLIHCLTIVNEFGRCSASVLSYCLHLKLF